jgi:hypothetical protein
MLSDIHQSIDSPPPPEQAALAEALEVVLRQRIHDLPGIVAALNAAGGTWSEASLCATLHQWGQ